MTTLIELFQERRKVLEQRLKSIKTPEQVANEIQNELSQFTDIDGPYIKELTPPEARIALSMLNALIESFNSLGSIRQSRPTYVPPSPTEPTRLQRSLGTIGGVVSGAIPGLVYGGPLGMVVGAIGGAVIGTGVSQFVRKNDQTPTTMSPPVPTFEVDVDDILKRLTTALEDIDRTVSRYRSDRAEEEDRRKPKLEDYPEILAFLQNFMGDTMEEDAHLPPEFKLRAQEIPVILKEYGIYIETFKPSTANANDKFDFESSLNPEAKEPLTVLPAFVKADGQLILRGRVTEPAA